MKRIQLLLIFSLCVLAGKAQPYQDKFLIMGSPQHLFVNGLSVDFDIKIKQNSWIVFSPQYYFDEKESTNVTDLELSGYNSMSGGGLGIANKLFLSKYPFYFSYGAAYHYFDIPGAHAVNRENDNYNYHIIEPHENITINRITGKCIFGFQGAIHKHLYVDLYLGFGIRYSIYNGNTLVTMSKSFYDYGYSGVMPFAGFRFGVGF